MIIHPCQSLCGLNGLHLRILDCGHARSAREWVGNVVSPSYSRLYYICGGDPYFTTAEGRTVEMKAGCCYFLPAGFSFDHACRTQMEQLYFHIQLIDDTGLDLFRGCSEMMVDTPGTERIQRMIELAASKQPDDALRLRQELYGTILSMLERHEVHLNRTDYARCILDAVAYIRKKLSVQLTVKQLAEHAHVSESTLEKAFRAELGMTVGRYVDEEIFLAAERQLKQTKLSIAQISERFGFCDQFYFSRRFRVRYGLSPQQYRKRYPF